ncbi:MAG: hypothetical protein CL559_01150, partial [Alphaproteobacteria bacterium]|nr:hypothetical protein [Alphaproteobacteria bacterium]
MAFTRPSPVRLVGLFLTAILVLLTLNYVRPALALDYTIRIDGLDDVDEEQAEEIRGLIRDTILLEQLRQDGAPSFFALERRAIADIDRINDVMRSRGFYASTIITEVEPDGPPVEDGGEPMPVAVIRLATGPLYTVGTVHVEQPGGGSVLTLDIADDVEGAKADGALTGCTLSLGFDRLAEDDELEVRLNGHEVVREAVSHDGWQYTIFDGQVYHTTMTQNTEEGTLITFDATDAP